MVKVIGHIIISGLQSNITEANSESHTAHFPQSQYKQNNVHCSYVQTKCNRDE